MEYVLTEEGKRKVAVFIKECEAKRKEILDAGLDTAEDTQIPTERVSWQSARISYRTQPACRSRSGKPLRLRNILMQLRKTLK